VSVDLEDFEFGLAERFPKAFAEKKPVVISTPRDVVDHLAARATPPSDPVLLLARAFYAIRRQLASQLDCPTEQITPRTRLADLLPDRASRPAQWDTLKAAIGVSSIPPLVRPVYVSKWIAVGVGIADLAAVTVAAASLGLTALVPVIGIASTVLGTWVGLRLTAHVALEFISPDLTVGVLARHAVAKGSPMLRATYPRMSRSQIIEVVRELLALESDLPCTDLDATWEELARAAARDRRRDGVAE
jgi:hypothetical protein